MSGSNAFASLDLNLLRVYRALIREGNVTRAAQSLNRTQSAVSSSLARLRESLGDVLFETTPKGIRPTDRGSELWTELEPYLSGLEQVLAPAVFDPSRFDGVFRICMSDFGVLQIMPRLFQQLQILAPHVQIDIRPVCDIDQLRAQLERGDLDIVMGTFYDETGDMRGRRKQVLFPCHHVCLMRRDHPLASGELTLERFLEARHVDVKHQGMTAPVHDALLGSKGIHRRVMLTLNSWVAVPFVVAQTDLVAVTSIELADIAGLGDQLCSRDLPVELPRRHYGLMWHSRDDNRVAHKWLRNLIAETCGAAASPGDAAAVSP